MRGRKRRIIKESRPVHRRRFEDEKYDESPEESRIAGEEGGAVSRGLDYEQALELLEKEKKKKRNRVAGEEEEGGGAGKNKFFACYLLTSLNPRTKGRTYIGFTVNPKRRIRQHNGEISMGATRTKRHRPWEMVMCIYGFPSNVAALKFEWAWQNPKESVYVRERLADFKSLNGLGNKIKLAHTMLTLPLWQRLDLTVNYFSTKYTKFAAGSPTLPRHIRLQVGSMDDLPCYTGGSIYVEEDDDLLSSDEGCDQSGESPESAENESAEGHKVINDDVPVVQDVFKLRGGRARRPILDTTEISQLSDELRNESLVSDSDKLTKNAGDVGISRSSEEFQFKNLPFGEQEVHRQSFRVSEEIHNSSIEHDPNLYEDLPSVESSEEFQPKNLRFGEQEVHRQSFRASEEYYKSSIEHDPNSYEDLPYSFTDYDEFAEDSRVLGSSKNSGFGEQNAISQSSHFKNNIILIDDEVEASRSRDGIMKCRESVAGHRERAFLSVDDCIDVEDRQARRNAVADEVEVIELCTPSPCQKRRKRSETETIDLTISPLIL